MRKELANSGLSEEEILTKTMLLQKALAGDNSPAFVNKTIKSAMSAAQITPSDLAKVSQLCQQAVILQGFFIGGGEKSSSLENHLFKAALGHSKKNSRIVFDCKLIKQVLNTTILMFHYLASLCGQKKS